MSDKDLQKSVFENLNLILAICAIAISAASFYATYIQAEAAEKQVKAATWPFLQFGSGNINEENELEISLNIHNGGVGPAHIKSFQLHYKNKKYQHAKSWVRDCCSHGAPFLDSITEESLNTTIGLPRTGKVQNTLLSANQEHKFFKMLATDKNKALWDEINAERHKLSATACYCSLLDICYHTDFKNTPVEVSRCPE
jgi:hypothetical protein